jgi:glycosyltransferase involved in cell wall biosynthesis
MRDDGLDEAQLAASLATLPPVIVCGPIAAPGEAARGGYQACNRRTIDALRAVGVDVRPLPFPHPRARGLRKLVAYGIGFLRLYAELLRCPRGAILHLTAVSAALVYPEWLLVKLARRHGLKIAFDLRAGAAQRLYEAGTPLYRRCFDSMARGADACFVEGEALAPFLARASGRAPTHLPNHLDTSAIPARRDEPLPAAPTLIYVGRVVAEKGVEVALGAARALRGDGIAARIEIAGEADPAYFAALRERHADLDVEWLGPLPSADVLARLARAHFFVFPTRHAGEGQSNALTEAIACGCVPVASRHGFNADVIGPAGATLPPEAGAADYAARIAALWRDPAAWRRLSAAARGRAAERFSTHAVVLRLVAGYQALAGVSS